MQGYQFDGTGVKSLDKIVLYSDNTSHIEGVWANGRHFTWNGKWRIVTDSYHDKAYRAIGFEYSAADGYAYIMIFISRNTALSIKESLMAKW